MPPRTNSNAVRFSNKPPNDPRCPRYGHDRRHRILNAAYMSYPVLERSVAGLTKCHQLDSSVTQTLRMSAWEPESW